jgi:guanine nucleotide-binding protein subunit alpha
MLALSSFFSSIHRITDPTYVPTQEDVLHARAKSTALIETRFWMGDLMCVSFFFQLLSL